MKETCKQVGDEVKQVIDVNSVIIQKKVKQLNENELLFGWFESYFSLTYIPIYILETIIKFNSLPNLIICP